MLDHTVDSSTSVHDTGHDHSKMHLLEFTVQWCLWESSDTAEQPWLFGGTLHRLMEVCVTRGEQDL